MGDALTRLPVRDARRASTRAGMRKRGASRRLPRVDAFFPPHLLATGRHSRSCTMVKHSTVIEAYSILGLEQVR